MDIDYAQIVNAYKDLEADHVKGLPPEERARYMENRAVKAEEVLAQLTLEQAKAGILEQFKLVEADDLADARTVTEAQKMAARIQAKAEKVAAATVTTATADIEKKIQDALKLKDDEMEQVRKAYGRPREVLDETQNQITDAEQRKSLGGGLEAREDWTKEKGTMKGVDMAAKGLASTALEMLLGGRSSQNG